MLVRHGSAPHHFLDDQDDSWEDIVAMSTGRAPRRKTSVIAGIVAIVALGAAAPALAGGQGAPPAPGGAGGSPAAVDIPAEHGALCELRVDKIRELRSGLPGGSDPESLRDAVWLLEERIELWESGAEGVPQAAQAARSAAAVEAAWREALQNHDAGKADGTRASLAEAEVRLAELDRQLRATPIPGCR